MEEWRRAQPGFLYEGGPKTQHGQATMEQLIFARQSRPAAQKSRKHIDLVVMRCVTKPVNFDAKLMLME
jgi:hypothetical protein